MKTTVPLTIADKNFNIACESSERANLIEAANIVDISIGKIKQHGNTVGSEKVAIMTALNIAIELLDTKNNINTTQENNNKIVDDILNSIDETIIKFK